MLVIQKIEIEGFRSFKDPAIIHFPESGMILIRGHYKGRELSSGSGKSTLLIAIAFCLGFNSIPATELKNWDSKVMRVALTLKDTVTGETFTIIRDPKLSILTAAGTQIAGADELLAKIIKTDSKLAEALTYREQRKPGNFINKTDAQKKEFLTVLLSLGQLEKALDDFDTELKILESNKAVLNSSIAATENALQLGTTSDDQLQAADAAYRAAHDRLAAAANAGSQIAQFRNEETQIRNELSKVRQLNTQAQVANSRNQNIRTQVMTVKAEIDKLKSNVCPTCLREWDNCGHLIEQKEVQIKTLIEQMQKNLEIISSSGTYSAAEQQFQNRLTEISHLVAQASAPIADATTLEISAANYLMELKSKKRNYDALAAKASHNQTELAKLDGEMTLTQHAIAILGREGFLGSIFDEVLMDIETRTNAMVSQLSNINGFTVSFPSTKVTQKGKVSKSITAELYRYGKKISIKAISGGQACAIELFSDLATSEAIRARSGSPLGWISLDEAMDGLDVEPKKEALAVIRANVSGQIFVIDHATEIKEGFEKVIEIVYDGKESHVSE